MPCEKSWWNSRRMTSASATSVTWNSSKQSSAADCGARSKEGLGTTCGRRRRRRERRRRGLRQRRRRTRRGRSGGRRRGRRRRGRRRRRSQAVCTSIGGRGRHVGKRGVRRWQARVAHRGARLGDVVCESRHRVTRAGVRLRAVPQTGCGVAETTWQEQFPQLRRLPVLVQPLMDLEHELVEVDAPSVSRGALLSHFLALAGGTASGRRGSRAASSRSAGRRNRKRCP